MEPKSNTGTNGGVFPGNPRADKTGTEVDSMDRKEELSPEFFKRFMRFKWGCLRTGDLLAVMQCHQIIAYFYFSECF
jgi:hypothetical protein